jgi:hypothetical protein
MRRLDDGHGKLQQARQLDAICRCRKSPGHRSRRSARQCAAGPQFRCEYRSACAKNEQTVRNSNKQSRFRAPACQRWAELRTLNCGSASPLLLIGATPAIVSEKVSAWGNGWIERSLLMT